MVKRWKPVRFALVGSWLGVGGAVLAAVAAIIRNRITRAE